MKLEKEKFFEIVDGGDHLNSGTREKYWDFYSDKCNGQLVKLYEEGDEHFTSGIHQYVKYSIDNSGEYEKPDSGNERRSSDIIKPLKSPSDRKVNKENVASWGTNVDVKGK